MEYKDRLNLDVDSPDKVAQVLRAAAAAFNESCADLSTTWQDDDAGRPWEQIARILANAAARVDRVNHVSKLIS